MWNVLLRNDFRLKRTAEYIPSAAVTVATAAVPA